MGMAAIARLPETKQELSDFNAQEQNTWRFLAAMHECTPEGTFFSYIQNCSSHAQTNQWLNKDEEYLEANYPSVPGPVGPKEFVEEFLSGSAPDASDPSRSRFWYANEESDISGSIQHCKSDVRRRRGVPPEGIASADTEKPPKKTGKQSEEKK